MNTRTFEKLESLFSFAQALRDRLEEARETLSDDEFDAMQEGPFGDILSAAMDVEDALEQCEAL